MASGIIAGASGKDALTAVTAAQNETLNNRLLHAKEISAIKQLAKGDASEEARLTAAACAMVLCYAEFPVDSDAYRQLKQLAIIGASDNLAGERQVISQQTGLFDYSTSGLLSDANIDEAKRLNNTYQLGTRALGAGQAVLGALGVAGSVATAPVSCVTGVGCVANAIAGTVSADAAYAGARQLVSGNSENTFLNQGLQGLGMSPEAAAITEAALGIGAAVTAGRVANQLTAQVSKLNDSARLSYAPIEQFGAKEGNNANTLSRPNFYVTSDGTAIPSTGYRAVGGPAVEEAATGTVAPRNPTYISFDNIKDMSPSAVQDWLQLPRTPSHWSSFDTLPLINDLKIPTGKWNTTTVPEPITSTFPEWGKGGGTQAITNQPIKLNGFGSLPTGAGK